MVVEVGSKPKLFLTLVGQCLKLAQWEFGSDNFHKIKITLTLHLKINNYCNVICKYVVCMYECNNHVHINIKCDC